MFRRACGDRRDDVTGAHSVARCIMPSEPQNQPSPLGYASPGARTTRRSYVGIGSFVIALLLNPMGLIAVDGVRKAIARIDPSLPSVLIILSSVVPLVALVYLSASRRPGYKWAYYGLVISLLGWCGLALAFFIAPPVF